MKSTEYVVIWLLFDQVPCEFKSSIIAVPTFSVGVTMNCLDFYQLYQHDGCLNISMRL